MERGRSETVKISRWEGADHVRWSLATTVLGFMPEEP
jgi:hypothetical protein